MKKLFLFLVIASAVLTVSVQSRIYASTTSAEKTLLDEKKKVEIPTTALPEKVSKSITDENKDCKVLKAYKVQDDKGAVAGYEVVVSINSKEETIKFDKDGNRSM
jgi:hypothetical protein